MMMTIETLETEVLKLSLIDRERLFKKLLLSLETPKLDEIEQLCREEVRSRVEAINNGEIEMIPSDVANKEIMEFLNNRYV